MSQTDQRAVAAQLWCLPQHAHKEMDVEFAESIAHALADAERRGMERAAKEVPTNWCDPLLTGPKGIAKADTAFTCRSIEQLLRGIQGRIRAQAQADK